MSEPIPFRTGDQALVREINLSLILSRLVERAPLSRAGLAEATGLNKSTVSSLVQELLDMRFVHEVGLNSSGVGRPSMQLALNPQAGYIVSCELGVDFMLVACANFAAEIIWRHREDTSGYYTSRDALIQRLRELLNAAITAARDAARAACEECGGLLGLAVGAPGLVDRHTGMLLFAPNLGWRDFPLYDILREDFHDVLLFVENEANLAAMGEYFFGRARSYHDVLSISAGIGLGGGLIRGGRLYRGTAGFAGEFGHMTMDPDGYLCNCGNRGCWETQVCQSALFRYVADAIAQGTPSQLDASAPLTIAQVSHAADQGDPAALEALHRVGRYLGIGIASLVNAFNPDLVVFGGTLSMAGDILLPVIQEELDRRGLRWNRDAATVVLAQHRSDAAMMGGVALVCQSVLAQPGSIVRRGL